MNESLTLVVLPIGVASFLVACLAVIQRWALQGKSSPALFLAVTYLFITIGFASVYVLAWGFTAPPNLRPGFWTAVFGGTIANYGIQFFHAKALTYQQGEVSFVSPLSATTPGLIMLLAITLGEFPGLIGWLGVVCITVGAWVILFKEKPEHWWEYFGPLYRLKLIFRFRSLSAEDKERAIVAWLALGGAALGSIGLLFDALYTRRGGDLQGMWLGVMSIWAMLGVGFFIQYALSKDPRKKLEWKDEKRKLLIAAVAYAILLIVAAWLITPTFFETYAAYVGTLSRLRILFAVVLGFLIFREQDIKKRLVAALIILVGVVLIASEDLPTGLTDRLELLGI